MNHTEQILHIADVALGIEEQPADAAALLVDAAAMNALECGLPLEDLIECLHNSHATLAAAKEAVETIPAGGVFREH